MLAKSPGDKLGTQKGCLVAPWNELAAQELAEKREQQGQRMPEQPTRALADRCNELAESKQGAQKEVGDLKESHETLGQSRCREKAA